MNIYKQIGKILLLSLFILVAARCDRDRRNPGWDYFPDMFYSNAYETYSVNENLHDGKTMLEPVEGTIPREMIPFQYGSSLEERTRAGRELRNPLEPGEENLVRGKEAYRIYCSSCHGEKGDGKGYLVTSGKYIYPVRTLIAGEIVDRPVGEIYHTITTGFGVMGAHGAQIQPEDRWKIIMYINEELQTETD